MTPSSPLRTQTRGWRAWPRASSSSRYDLVPLLVSYGNTLHQGPGPGQEDGGDVAGGPGLQLRLAGDPQEVRPAVRGERVQAVQPGVCEVSCTVQYMCTVYVYSVQAVQPGVCEVSCTTWCL